MFELFVVLEFDLEKNKYKIKSNVKDCKNFIFNFLRTQIGVGEDLSIANKINNYTITITLDLTTDIFSVEHNCGNLGLRDGILLNFLRQE
jgi:hypothetical protein